MIWLFLILLIPGGLNYIYAADILYKEFKPCDDTNITARIYRHQLLEEKKNQYFLLIPIPAEAKHLVLKFDSAITIKLVKPGRRILLSRLTSLNNDYSIRFLRETEDKILNCTVIGHKVEDIPYIRSISLDQRELCSNPKTGYFDDFTEKNKIADIVSSIGLFFNNKLILNDKTDKPSLLFANESDDAPSSLFTNESDDTPSSLFTNESDDAPSSLFTNDKTGKPSSLFTNESDDAPSSLFINESDDAPSSLFTNDKTGKPSSLFTNESDDAPSSLLTNESDDAPSSLFTNDKTGKPSSLFTNEEEDTPSSLFTNKNTGAPSSLFTNESDDAPSSLFTNDKTDKPSSLFTNEEEDTPSSLFTAPNTTKYKDEIDDAIKKLFSMISNKTEEKIVPNKTKDKPTPDIVFPARPNPLFLTLPSNDSQTEDSEPSLEQTCGRPKAMHTELIVHGQSTKSGYWPWHVAIFRIEKSSLRYICGGTLLSKTLVLTAAHCGTKGGNAVIPEAFRVDLGKLNLFGGDVGTQEREVFQVIIHPKFDAVTVNNDIALLKLKSEAVFTHYVRPACLWYEQANVKLPHQAVFGTVVGWGYNHKDTLSATLQQATMPILSELVCLKSNPIFYSQKLNKNKFCAGFGNGTSACNGDSGGGLMVFVPDTPGTASGAWYVRGIVSIAPRRYDANNICDPYEYTILTDVEQYRDWVLGYLN